jgi:membrane protein
MLRTFDIPLTWGELVQRTYKEMNEDDVLGLAAQLAYYTLLALVPAIVAVVAIASFFPPTTLQDALTALRGVAPADVLAILDEQLRSLAGRSNGGVLTFGFLFALWSSSAALVAITNALNRAYDVEEGRPWWKVRLVAVGLTIALAVFIVIAVFLVMLGPTVAEQLASQMGLGRAFELGWKILQWPVVLGLVALGIAMINYFAPDVEQDWEWITPGALVATVLWLLSSLAFKFYLTNFADYNATYGSLGGVIVLMLWFYISALAVLIGAEMNAEIEHASPHGKDPGEKVPGEKTKIGAAAARAYEERKRRGRGSHPVVRPDPAPARPYRPASALSKVSAYPGALVYLLVRMFRRERS